MKRILILDHGQSPQTDNGARQTYPLIGKTLGAKADRGNGPHKIGGLGGLEKIISGGQTGVDRMALDFAIWHDLPHGGWCPKGRKAEDGPLDAKYSLTETPSSNYLQRTEWNVRDSDGTVIFSIAPVLTGGSKRTVDFASRHGKPLLHIHPRGAKPELMLLDFLRAHSINTLNVAGPRASKEPEAEVFVKQVLENAFYPRPSSCINGPGEG